MITTKERYGNGAFNRASGGNRDAGDMGANGGGYPLGRVINQWQTEAERQDDIAQLRRVVVASALAIAAVLLWVGYLCLANAATGQATQTAPGQASHWKGPRLQNRQARVMWGARGVGGVA